MIEKNCFWQRISNRWGGFIAWWLGLHTVSTWSGSFLKRLVYVPVLICMLPLDLVFIVLVVPCALFGDFFIYGILPIFRWLFTAGTEKKDDVADGPAHHAEVIGIDFGTGESTTVTGSVSPTENGNDVEVKNPNWEGSIGASSFCSADSSWDSTLGGQSSVGLTGGPVGSLGGSLVAMSASKGEIDAVDDVSLLKSPFRKGCWVRHPPHGVSAVCKRRQ